MGQILNSVNSLTSGNWGF